MTLDEFVAKYDGKPVEANGNVPGQGAYDQCVDLANEYLVEVLGKPMVLHANAIDFPDKIGSGFEYILNTPTNIPQKGDLVIWKPSPGHIAVFINGDANNFHSFDQNFPKDSPCHIQYHSYTNVIGWLRAKEAQNMNMYKGYDLDNNDSMKVAVDILVEVQQGQFMSRADVDAICANLGIPSGASKDAIIIAVNQMKSGLSKAQADSTSKDQTIINLNKQIPDLEGQINTLGNKVASLTQQLETAQSALIDPQSKVSYKDLYEQSQAKNTPLQTAVKDLQETNNRQIAQYQKTSYLLVGTGVLFNEIVKRILHLK